MEKSETHKDELEVNEGVKKETARGLELLNHSCLRRLGARFSTVETGSCKLHQGRRFPGARKQKQLSGTRAGIEADLTSDCVASLHMKRRTPPTPGPSLFEALLFFSLRKTKGFFSSSFHYYFSFDFSLFLPLAT